MAKRYQVRLIGETPLLMHKDNISFGEKVRAWSKDPNNKKISVAGDDRTPAWTWLGYCYHDNKQLTVDADNLMSVLRDGGKKCPAPTGKGSMKSLTQSGIMVNEIGWPLLIKGTPLAWKDFAALENETDFAAHEQFAVDHGFELFVKRAKIGAAKHVRVRPRFDQWEAVGSLTVLDSQITKQVLEMVLKFAGVYCGLGDWRPSSQQSPGQFGRFSVEIVEQ